MRFPSRPVLAASVLAALATSGGTVLTMPDYPADAAEAGSPPGPQAAVPAGEAAVAPAPGAGGSEASAVPQVAGPPVTGAQIAGLAVAPARERAGALVGAQAAAEAAAAARAAEEERARREAEDNEDDEDRSDRSDRSEEWEDDFRRELREACEDGRVRGQICRGA